MHGITVWLRIYSRFKILNLPSLMTFHAANVVGEFVLYK